MPPHRPTINSCLITGRIVVNMSGQLDGSFSIGRRGMLCTLSDILHHRILRGTSLSSGALILSGARVVVTAVDVGVRNVLWLR